MKRKVPTPDETAASRAAYEARQAGLKTIADQVRHQFGDAHAITFSSLYSYAPGKVAVRLVFPSAEHANAGAGIKAELTRFICAALEEHGHTAGDLALDFDFDYDRPRKPIPIDANARFERAVEERASDFDGLDEVSAAFTARFSALCPLDYFSIMPGLGARTFQAYVFLKSHADVLACERTGLDTKMMDAVKDLVGQHRGGDREKFTIEFEFDSWENVERNYEGNYFLRLR
jgi:hypothetical protein